MWRKTKLMQEKYSFHHEEIIIEMGYNLVCFYFRSEYSEVSLLLNGIKNLREKCFPQMPCVRIMDNCSLEINQYKIQFLDSYISRIVSNRNNDSEWFRKVNSQILGDLFDIYIRSIFVPQPMTLENRV